MKGKKYTDSRKLIEKGKLYDPDEVFALVCETSKAKFDETIELHMRLGVDSRHADQQVRGAIVLPNGTGKTARVLVFAKGTARKRRRLRAPSTSAKRIWSKRSRKRTGLILTSLSRLPT